MQLNPLTLKKIQRFRSIKRGYYSFLFLLVTLILSMGAEMLVNSRALVVKYDGEFYFPTYGAIHKGSDFGLDYEYETNYRELRDKFEADPQSDNWVLMPLVPYNAYEFDVPPGDYPPHAPNAERQHYLGTDVYGRDVLARLVYGFRTAMGFALTVLAISFAIGISIGCVMGFSGGRTDLIGQRLIEIWSMLPGLYVIMIMVSILGSSFWLFVILMVLFYWVGPTWYMRTMTYKEKAREYVMAARAQGAGTARIIFKHILPNTLVMVITLAPFTIVALISALTALDYLGLGLAPPTPSWGELLQQGKNNLESSWIVLSVIGSIVVVLTMVTFIGEAVREAFDPKKHTVYV